MAPRRLSALDHLLEHLPISQRVHRPPETLIFVGHQVPCLDQAVERLEHQLFPVPDVIEDLVAEDEISAVDPDVGLLTGTQPFAPRRCSSNSAR